MEAERERASQWFKELSGRVIAALEQAEREFPAAAENTPSSIQPGRFITSRTRRTTDTGQDGGGGTMALLRGGRILEKAGVNTSTVFGKLSPATRKAMADRLHPVDDGGDNRFWASGVSLVVHPRNPHVPAVHMNTRMFWTPAMWWFGGGTDLNPAIAYDEDSDCFHDILRQQLEPHGAGLYPKFKEWADKYFFIPHRKCPRGVGGIFMDDYNSGDWEADFALICTIGEAFLPSWLPIAEKRAAISWSDGDRQRQLLYRGLYAEFNLVHDRGTRFGLASGHDPDAVLMSLPPLARWR